MGDNRDILDEILEDGAKAIGSSCLLSFVFAVLMAICIIANISRLFR